MSEIPTEFWTKWIDANPIERIRMSHELAQNMDMVVVAMASDIPDDAKYRIIGNLMNSYFEDLFYTSIPIIEKRKMHPAQSGVTKK